MKSLKGIQKFISQFKVKPRPEMRSKVLDEALEIQRSRQRQCISGVYTWRMIMQSRITKLAAAAVIILVAALSITLLDKTVTPAYAIEQTIEAGRSIRYIHLKYYVPSKDDLEMEFWFEFDENRKLQRMRRDHYNKRDGNYQTIVWEQGETQFWRRKDNRLIIFDDEIYTTRTLGIARAQDPRNLVERIYKNQLKGEVEIDIEEPLDKSEPIVLTATYPDHGRSFVLFIDQSTKFVEGWESYVLKDGEYKFDSMMKCSGYNATKRPSIFTLDDELPNDTNVFHRTLSLETSPNRKILDRPTLMSVNQTELLMLEFKIEQEYEDALENEKQSMTEQWITDAQGDDYEKKVKAIAALGNVASPKALDVLIEIAKADSKGRNRPRWMAVRALGRIADPTAIPVLINLLDHYSKDTALYAKVALAEITGVYFGNDKTKWQQWWDQNKEDFG